MVPEIRTLARPVSGPLLAARGVVQRSDLLRAAFEHARRQGQTPEQLAGAITPELERVLDCPPEEAVQVAQYLADEYFQIGDAILVIDRATGLAIARLTEQDIWQPPDVPRESGGMARPLPRIRPDLEGALISYHFDRAKEQVNLAKVQQRFPGTLSLQDEGNTRLRVVTRGGRHDMTEDVRDRLPTLLGAVQGTPRAFLDHFDIRDEAPAGLTAFPMATAVARSQQSIADPLTFNLRYDLPMALGARIGTAWVREIAARVASMVKDRLTLHYQELQRRTFEPADFWVVSPDAFAAFMPFVDRMMPVLNTEPTGLIGKVGSIVVQPGSYRLNAREVFARWEIVATLDYTLYLDITRLMGLEVQDLPIEALAEII
jgi:hypothetical protein